MIEGPTSSTGTGSRRSSGRTFERRNPADHDDVIGTFPESDASDVATPRSTRSAKAAPQWAATPPERRAAILEAAAAHLEPADELVDELVREEGKTRRRGHHGGRSYADEPAVLRR